MEYEDDDRPVPITKEFLDTLDGSARRVAVAKYQKWLARERKQDRKNLLHVERKVWKFRNPELYKKEKERRFSINNKKRYDEYKTYFFSLNNEQKERKCKTRHYDFTIKWYEENKAYVDELRRKRNCDIVKRNNKLKRKKKQERFNALSYDEKKKYAHGKSDRWLIKWRDEHYTEYLEVAKDIRRKRKRELTQERKRAAHIKVMLEKGAYWK